MCKKFSPEYASCGYPEKVCKIDMAFSNSLTQLQERRNQQSVNSWATAESHRQRVTDLLKPSAHQRDPTLCVLGAGNCNDIDLKRLATFYQRIALVDIDQAALERGVAAQKLTISDQLQIHGTCDLTGIWPLLSRLGQNRETPNDEIDALLAASAAWPGLTHLGQFDTVTSTCVLSQLIDGVIQSLGEQHSRCMEVIAAIRQRHLQLMQELTVSGGRAVLATDFVSTDTAPTLPTLSREALAGTLAKMIEQQNFFTGLNPFRLQSLLADPGYLHAAVTDVNMHKPWLWNLGPRQYAVTAISFQVPPSQESTLDR